MSYVTRMKGLLGGAALSLVLLPALSGSASACVGVSFIDTGCFSSVTAQYYYPTGSDGQSTPGYIQLQNNGAFTVPVLTLSGASSAINYVTLSYKSGVDGPPPAIGPDYQLTLTGANSPGGAAITFSVLGTGLSFAPSTPLFQTVTFFSAAGVQAGGNLSFQAGAFGTPIYAELGHIAVAAPAPIPGAGFLSFLGMGFAGMFRRGRSVLSRLALRKSAAQAA